VDYASCFCLHEFHVIIIHLFRDFILSIRTRAERYFDPSYIIGLLLLLFYRLYRYRLIFPLYVTEP